MSTLVLAWRNVLRNRRRSALTIFTIVSGMVAVLIFGGFMASILKNIEISVVRATGHLQILHKDYLLFGSSDPIAYAMDDVSHLMEIIKNDSIIGPLTTVITPRLRVEGVAGNFDEGISTVFIGTGVVPVDDEILQNWDPYQLRAGESQVHLNISQLESGVIGQGLARLLHLCTRLQIVDCKQPSIRRIRKADNTNNILPLPIGTNELATSDVDIAQEGKGNNLISIDLLAAASGGAPNVVRLNIIAAERQGRRELDDVYVSMPLQLAQHLVYGKGSQAATMLIVQLKSTTQIPIVKARLSKLLSDSAAPLEVRDFKEIDPMYNQTTSFLNAIFGFISLLMGIICIFGVANAVTMAISERFGEIGTLRALGLKRRDIQSLFIIEGGLLGVLGGGIGAFLSLLIAISIDILKLHWTPPGDAKGILLRIDLLGSPSFIIIVWVSLIILACTAAWLPARRASKLEITNALNHI